MAVPTPYISLIFRCLTGLGAALIIIGLWSMFAPYSGIVYQTAIGDSGKFCALAGAILLLSGSTIHFVRLEEKKHIILMCTVLFMGAAFSIVATVYAMDSFNYRKMLDVPTRLLVITVFCATASIMSVLTLIVLEVKLVL